MSRRPRLLPGRSFPPYRHRPGVTPHPERDPSGHHHGGGEPAPLDPAGAGENADYLHAFDLFNHGYFWEAHAAWEGLWNAAGREGRLADLLKALIRLSAAGVKARQGQGAGVRSHAGGAAALLRSAAATGGPRLAGVDLIELAELSEDVAAAQPNWGPHPDLEGDHFAWVLRPR